MALKTMTTLRFIGIGLMLIGMGLKLTEITGHTTAFVAGAVLIIFARTSQWFIPDQKKPEIMVNDQS